MVLKTIRIVSDWVLNGVEHTNFFENRATEYNKGTVTGNL